MRTLDNVTGADLGCALEVTAICDGRGSPTWPSLSEKVKETDTTVLLDRS